MVFEKDYMPQFRETDPDGFIGLRGYMSYFQDVATHYMHNLDKGNDVIPEKYGISWMYTKYKLHIIKKADFTDALHFETWVEKKKSAAVVSQGLKISRNGEAYAHGRLESCLFDKKAGRLTRTGAIELPEDIAIERQAEVEPFTKIPRTVDGTEYRYTHKVCYTDLDKSGHMTNLQYVNLLLNAFESGFYKTHRITDFEIHYVSQCFEGEEIRVYAEEGEKGVRLLAVHADESLAALGNIGCGSENL